MIKLSGLPDPLEARPWRERIAPMVLLYAAALALRAGYAFLATGPGAIPSSDPAEYDQVAWNLASGAGFALGEGAFAHSTAFVPPLLPWITSLLYTIVGHDYFAAVLLQCAIGATVPLLVVRLGTMLFGGAVGRLGGWLAAGHPLLVFFSAYLLTETLFCATLLVALVASVEWVRAPRAGRALLAGLAWGLAALTRPTALPLPIVVVAWAWPALTLSLGPRGRARQIVLVFLGVAALVGPWTLRNASVFGAFVPVTTGSGRALLDGNNPMAWDDPVRRGGAYMDLEAEPYRSLLTGGSEVELDARARAHAVAFALSRVPDWPGVALAKFTRFWRLSAEGGGTGAWQRSDSPLTDVLRTIDPLLVWSLVVIPLALWGLVRSVRGPRRWFQSLPVWMIAYFTLVGIVFWGSLRMRVPVEPLVVMLAAVGFEGLRPSLRRWLPRAVRSTGSSS